MKRFVSLFLLVFLLLPSVSAIACDMHEKAESHCHKEEKKDTENCPLCLSGVCMDEQDEVRSSFFFYFEKDEEKKILFSKIQEFKLNSFAKTLFLRGPPKELNLFLLSLKNLQAYLSVFLN